MNELNRHLGLDDILLDVQVADKIGLFHRIGQHMAQMHGLSPDAVSAALSRREAIGSTALGQGVAIPHARVDGLDRVRIVYLRLKPAIRDSGPDGDAVTDVLALLVPAPATQQHLDLLADAASALSTPAFRQALRVCGTPREVKDLLARWRS